MPYPLSEDLLEAANMSSNISSRHYNLSVTEILDRPTLWQKTQFLHQSEMLFACLTPVIIAVGLVGNGLSLAVFMSKGLRKLTASTYLTALSLADTATLLFYVFVEWLRRGIVILNPELKLKILDQNGMCQILLYLAYVSRFMSAWIIVLFTVERFTGICHPLRSFKRSGRKVLLMMFLLAGILMLFKPATSTSSTIRGRTACRPNPAIPEILSYSLDLLFALTITFIPFLVITVLNILIVRALYLRNRDGDLFSEDTNTRIRLEFTLILVSISFFFIAFNFPYTVVWSRYFLTSHPDYNINSFQKVDNDFWIGLLNVTRTVFYMNYCINFFLYNITGRCFRKTLRGMFRCRMLQPRRRDSYIRCNYIGNTNTQTSMISKLDTSTCKSNTAI